MTPYLLQVSSYFIIALPIILVLVILFIEAYIIYLRKINNFSRSLIHSLLVNAVSLVAMVATTPLLSMLNYKVSPNNIPLPVFTFFCWLSIVVEGFCLKALSKNQSAARVLGTSIIMNLLSFGIVQLFIRFSH